MYYSYIEIDYVATSFSPSRMDLAVKLLNKAHQIMTYLTLLLFPTIMSWLLTKLANVSHDLTQQWEWNHFGWQFVTTPGSTTRRRKQDNLARAKTKDKGKGSSH